MTSSAPRWLHESFERGREKASFFGRFDPPQGRPSAVLMLFGQGSRGPDVVLTERGANLRNHASQVSFPGGRMDPDDADEVFTALREADEEIDLDPNSVEVLGALPTVPLSVTGHAVTPVVGWWREPGHLYPKSTHEVARVARVGLHDLADPENRHTATHPRGFAGPAFTVDGFYVWGFTALLVDAFLDLSPFARTWNRGDRRQVPEQFLR